MLVEKVNLFVWLNDQDPMQHDKFCSYHQLLSYDHLCAGQKEIRNTQEVMIEAQEKIERQLSGAVADIHLLLLESKDHMTTGSVRYCSVLCVICVGMCAATLAGHLLIVPIVCAGLHSMR
jgi:hypothetical protein